MTHRFLLFCLLICANLSQAQVDPALFSDLQWRAIGPLRAGRTRTAVGVPEQPNVFYIGVCNGGVWKTTDYGRTWQPIFDRQPTNSIGAIAVAPGAPDTIYVGSGEGLQRPDLSVGDGIYKSTDAGLTWTHLGLRDGQQIPRIVVDPRNPDRLFVAVLGHPYGPNTERGVYRSNDGGKTFERVLYRDENTGASWVEIDSLNPDMLYAALWESRQGPWENGVWTGTGGIFKSTDGGTTWKPLTNGLPQNIIQANLATSPGSHGFILATVATPAGVGIYLSTDYGNSWTRTTDDPRPAGRIGGGDLPVPAMDPKDINTFYIASTVAWKSTDRGKTWTAVRGAPGGDDYQGIWINPSDPSTILLVADQGAVITVNGGRTWSSWYNQPTAQMYHVIADNAFPYRVCGGQQESGSACVSSRGDFGQITMREWTPVGVEEYGYVAPDPLDPDIVYGGKLSRWDRRTGQVSNVSPVPLRTPNFRVLRTSPVVFSPADPKLLLFAGNTLWKTRDGGANWQQISPDLTRKTYEIPPNIGKYRQSPTAQPTQRGVIYAVAPSPLDVKRIWAGTDDGLIHVTVDGGLHWQDVTPKQLVPFAKVSILEASRFHAATAYAAVNTLRLDDMRPHIYRTRDNGKTWTEIVNGIPNGAPVNVVREDPKRKGLLYAGTEREVYASFDDGDHWQSVRLNMPASSIRDLVIKDDDLIVGTHGRGFWILDNITPLRQLAATPVTLYKPQTALRVRWNMNTDTPLPPDEPGMKNPPDGAMIDYYLASQPSGPVTLEILDSKGNLVRRYASNDPVEPLDPMLEVPAYWVRPPQVLSAAPGMHRFLWDMHYTPLTAARNNYPIAAVYQDTPIAPSSPWVLPGVYTVKLTVDGKSYSQPLTVKMDPRVKTPAAGLAQQFTLSKQLYDDLQTIGKTLAAIEAARPTLRQKGMEEKATAIAGAREGGRRRGPVAAGPDTLNRVSGAMNNLLRLLQEADVAPTTPQIREINRQHASLTTLLARWKELNQ